MLHMSTSTIMHACNMAGKHACASWQEQFAQQWPMSNLHQRLASNAWQEQCTMAKVVLASHHASMAATLANLNNADVAMRIGKHNANPETSGCLQGGKE